MTSHIAYGSLLAACLVLASGCGKNGSPAGDARATPSEIAQVVPRSGDGLPHDLVDATVHDSGQIAVPLEWRLPSVAHVKRADSWDARLALLPEAEQTWLRELNDRYAGALAFSSPEEQERLIQQGFPMPEEWLAARGMHDEELEKLASSGNSKARMLHIDRVGSQIASIRGSGKGLTTSPEDRELLRRYTDATVMAGELLRKTRSPYAAYLYGQLFRSGSQYNPPEYLAGGIMMAEQLGDSRTGDIRREFLKRYPGMKAGHVMSASSNIQSALDRGKP